MRTVHPYPVPPSPFDAHPQFVDLDLMAAAPIHAAPPMSYSSRPASPTQANLSTLVSELQSAAHAAAHAAAAADPSATRANAPAISHAEAAASIQTIIAAAAKAPSPANGQSSPWPPPATSGAASPAPPAATQTTLGKRKLEDGTDAGSVGEDTHAKIRRVVRDHVSLDPRRMLPMTTVVCLHAAVAQKSYGTEKRFLCPPPVVHVEGPVWRMRQQQLSMSVVAETGERSFDQKAPLDGGMSANFKFLHVTGTAKAKSFQLSLDIAEPAGPENATGGGGRVWASFDSAPVAIISKPSKKTAKTRNISSCILAGGPVSLFNRINSQTVRTKYMTIDHTQLCASNVTWSAFNVNVVRRSTDATPLGGPTPVTYGSEIVLSDTHSGISTAPLVVRKVDKGRIINDDGGPVSQMQKIALQRINPDGSRHYLSAAGPMPGTPGGVVAPPAPGMSQQAGSHPLLFQTPRIREEVKDGARLIVDEVDDYLCWTIVGISKFQYTFFDAFGQGNSIPEMPITPFPTLFTAPSYRPPNNTLELTVSNFFYEDPKTRAQTPLDVYLGNIGPLRARVYQGAPSVPMMNMSPYSQSLGVDGASGEAGSPMSRYAPTAPLHSIVIVEMPDIADVIKAIAEDISPGSGEGGVRHSPTATEGEAGASKDTAPPLPPPQALAGRTLPLLFIRSSDGVGYHSGRTIALENVFSQMEMQGGAPHGAPSSVDTAWLAAAQAAANGETGMSGWTLRVM